MSKSILPKGVFKMTPEDFVVQHILSDREGRHFPLALFTESLVEGYDPRYPVTVFCMSKVGWDTKRATKEVARALGLPNDAVQYNALKDKQGCTSQPISVAGSFRKEYQHDTIHLVQMYGQYEHLKRGRGYHGNHFTINVRSSATSLDLDAVKVIYNLWGRQRLGNPGTEGVGLALFEGRFDDAIKMLLKSPSARDLEEARKASGGSYMDALFHREFAYNFGFEVGKWQSFLWNQLFQELLAAGTLPDRLPMWQPTKEVTDMYRHLWNPTGKLSREALEVLDSQRRPTVVSPTNFQAKYKDGVWRFVFDLSPSVYATVVLEKLFDLKEVRERG